MSAASGRPTWWRPGPPAAAPRCCAPSGTPTPGTKTGRSPSWSCWTSPRARGSARRPSRCSCRLDHIVTMPDTMEYFIDSASTVDTPPVTRVRAWPGGVLVELERADISKLTATGWTPPERFCVKAADGVTDIYGVLYRPWG